MKALLQVRRGDWVLVLTVLVGALAIGTFVRQAMTQVREALPGQVLDQQSDIAYVVQDLGELVSAVSTAVRAPEPRARRHVLARLHASSERLQAVRASYNFDNLVGASAVHAAVFPALQDIERWLEHGAGGEAGDSPLLMKLVEARAREAHREAQALFVRSNETAASLVARESANLERLRDSLTMYLATFALLTVGVVVLLLRQRNAQTRLSLARKRLTESIESLDEGFALFDREDRLVECNQRFRDLFPALVPHLHPGVSFTELVQASRSQNLIEAIGDDPDADPYDLRLNRHRNPFEPFDVRLRTAKWVRISERATMEGGVVGIYTDVTEERRSQSQLLRRATHDALTDLPNRAHFAERLEQAVARSRRHGHSLALMLLDLDHFKRINDTQGHAAGDELLQTVARRLKSSLREEDTLARLGGDEFAALIECVKDWREVAAFAERAVDNLAGPVRVGSRELQISASIGVALFPRDAHDIAALLAHADTACYHAKALGRNNFQFYTPEMNTLTAKRATMERHLHRALERDELQLSFVPRCSPDGNEVLGMAARLHWDSPELGHVPATSFLPVADELGLGNRVLEWVLEEACRQNQSWHKAGLQQHPVYVPVGERRFRHQGLLERVERALQRTGLPAQALCLEAPESLFADDGERVLRQLNNLAALGVRVGVSDFGRGKAPLAWLAQAPLEFVCVTTNDARPARGGPHAPLAAGLCALAHRIGLTVVCTEVDDETIRQACVEWGCDLIQGTALGPAMSPDEAARYLASRYLGGAAVPIGLARLKPAEPRD